MGYSGNLWKQSFISVKVISFSTRKGTYAVYLSLPVVQVYRMRTPGQWSITKLLLHRPLIFLTTFSEKSSTFGIWGRYFMQLSFSFLDSNSISSVLSFFPLLTARSKNKLYFNFRFYQCVFHFECDFFLSTRLFVGVRALLLFSNDPVGFPVFRFPKHSHR